MVIVTLGTINGERGIASDSNGGVASCSMCSTPIIPNYIGWVTQMVGRLDMWHLI